MLDDSSSPSATHKYLILNDFFTFNQSAAKPRNSLRDLRCGVLPLTPFGETFRGVRRRKFANSPLRNLAVRLPDAEFQHAQSNAASASSLKPQ
jgi:hypothetical protein